MIGKSLGVIGGAGPMAGILLCEYIISVCQNLYGCKDDHDFPLLVLRSIPFHSMLTDDFETRRAKLQGQLKEALMALKDSDKVVIACNTLHAFLDSKPSNLISLIDITQSYLSNKNIQKPLILGTTTSKTNKVHPFIGGVYPNTKNQLAIDKVIDWVLSGKSLEEAKEFFIEVVERCLMDSKDSDAVVFGCTELSVLMRSGIADVCMFNMNHQTIISIDPLKIVAYTLCDAEYL